MASLFPSNRRLPAALASAIIALGSAIAHAGAPTNVLSLESPACVADEGGQLQVELWLRNPSQPITGFQAFIQFDPVALTFLGVPSCYTKCSGAVDMPCNRGPFQLQFPSNIANAAAFPGAMPGQLNISGSTAPSGACAAPATSDALIAILVFQIGAGQNCAGSQVEFRPFGDLNSEVSFQGSPIPTNLSPSPVFVFDNTPPDVMCPMDVIVPCTDPTSPAATGTASANDNCSPAFVSFTDMVTPGKDPAARTILRTWSAIDDCGNLSTCLQTIEVIPAGPDTDSDGVLDCVDNCLQAMNPDQADCDSNGIGNACDANDPPQILQQPVVQAVCAGSAASFTIDAAGLAPLTYQWRRDGDDLVDGPNVSGAQSPGLTLSPVFGIDSGDYDCLITDVCGETISDAAELVVFEAGSGDPSHDGQVNGLDIQGMVDALLSGGPPATAYCACELTGDGIVDAADVTAFVDLLLAI